MESGHSDTRKRSRRKSRKTVERTNPETSNEPVVMTPANPASGPPNSIQERVNRRSRGQVRVGASRNPRSQDPSSSEQNSENSSTHRGGRSRNRGRPQPRDPGTITRDGIAATEGSSTRMNRGRRNLGGLSASAPAFTPGQLVPGENLQQRGFHSQPRKVRAEKKEAEDVMGRIHDALSSNTYECMVCCDMVKRHQSVWSCKRCWAVFHLGCVATWAKKSLEDGHSWRCPGCQNPLVELPGLYSCWCGKAGKPALNRYLVPHSCGEPCGKDRGCPHFCNLLCHAGPCPPCPAMGPVQTCFCGRSNSQKRCTETDYDDGWSCGKTCGELLACGHSCLRPCHDGFCGACTLLETVLCYCGKVEMPIMCGEQLAGRESVSVSCGTKTEWIGKFECDNPCERLLECGIHRCSKRCHPQEEKPMSCSLSPERVSSCPCGATKLEKLLATPRKHCPDPIPTCQRQCNKLLSCGHLCKSKCHHGECHPCKSEIMVRCCCGNTEIQTTCVERVNSFQPECNTICRVLRSCGRHECGRKCCLGYKNALTRMKGKKRVPNVHLEDFEPEHLCTLICNKSLPCGNHNCSALCHKGPCPSCLEASFEERVCHCGRSRLHPPIPCGIKVPSCQYPCQRDNLCRHPRILHECHPNDEACPRCPYHVERPCICGETLLRNQPCWRQNGSCSKPCRRKLACGIHECSKVPCHKPESCENPCRNLCGKARKLCGHPCVKICHGSIICPEGIETTCRTKITITCTCGQLRQDVPCNTNTENTTASWRRLTCTDSCAIAERNQKLAQALTIDPDRPVELDQSYHPEILDYYAQNKVWTCNIEKQFRQFMQQDDLQKLSFKPMKSLYRKFIHQLAESYNLESEALDPEPYRSVVCQKTYTSQIPSKSLSVAYIVYKSQAKHVMPIPHAISQLRKPTTSKSFNSIFLENIKVGLLQDELSDELDEILKTSCLKFEITWIDGEQIVLHPQPCSFTTQEIEHELYTLKPLIKDKLASKNLALVVELTWMNRDGRVSYSESTVKKGGEILWESPATRAKNTSSLLDDARLPETHSQQRGEETADYWEMIGKDECISR